MMASTDNTMDGFDVFSGFGERVKDVAIHTPASLSDLMHLIFEDRKPSQWRICKEGNIEAVLDMYYSCRIHGMSHGDFMKGYLAIQEYMWNDGRNQHTMARCG